MSYDRNSIFIFLVFVKDVVFNQKGQKKMGLILLRVNLFLTKIMMPKKTGEERKVENNQTLLKTVVVVLVVMSSSSSS